eukprot:436955-Pyramimonas_sp.AAC.1
MTQSDPPKICLTWPPLGTSYCPLESLRRCRYPGLSGLWVCGSGSAGPGLRVGMFGGAWVRAARTRHGNTVESTPHVRVEPYAQHGGWPGLTGPGLSWRGLGLGTDTVEST